MTVICHACIKDKDTGELKEVKRLDEMSADERKAFTEELIISGATSMGYRVKK